MKIIDRKIIDANLMPNKFMIEMMFRCKLEKVYVYNLKHEDGAIGAISAYFNRRDNIIYMMISKKTTEGIKHIGAVEVKEGQYGIEESLFKAVLDKLGFRKNSGCT